MTFWRYTNQIIIVIIIIISTDHFGWTLYLQHTIICTIVTHALSDPHPSLLHHSEMSCNPTPLPDIDSTAASKQKRLT